MMQILFVINISGIQSNTIVQLLMESEVGRQENLFHILKGKLSTLGEQRPTSYRRNALRRVYVVRHMYEIETKTGGSDDYL